MDEVSKVLRVKMIRGGASLQNGGQAEILYTVRTTRMSSSEQRRLTGDGGRRLWAGMPLCRCNYARHPTAITDPGNVAFCKTRA
jgi:hypothetical protein